MHVAEKEQADIDDIECAACGAVLCTLVKRTAPPRQRRLQRGERVSWQSCTKLWTVRDGLTALCMTLLDGRRQIVGLSVPGDLICPVSGPDVWIEALTPSAVCELDFTPLADSIDQNAPLSAELFRTAHRQVRNTSAHLVALGRLDGMERICLFLAEMAWRMGARTPDGWRVDLPLSREDIADYLGLNAETVSRILGRVKKAKLATFLTPTEYLVPNMEALQNRAPMLPPSAPIEPIRPQPVVAELCLA